MPHITRLFIALLLLSGCSMNNIPGIYKVDIRQGNYLEPEDLARLQPGMSKRQVQNLLGTPLINDPFNQDRWDYVYTFRPEGKEAIEQRHLTLFFSGEVLERMDNRTSPQTVN